MQILPVDLTALVSAFMGILVVLVPVTGLTLRFALKPTVEALGRFFEGKGSDEAMRILERRIALLEQQLEATETEVHRLQQVTEFHDRLRAGAAALPSPGATETKDTAR